MKALLFASVASLLAITVDRCIYIVRPLRYPLLVTKRRVFVAMSGIWLTACSVFIFFLVHIQKSPEGIRSLCHLDKSLVVLKQIIIVYAPLTLIIILNVWILIVAEKQRKRILAETTTNTGDVNRFFHAFKAVKTFIIVVAVLIFCVLTPAVVGLLLKEISSCSDLCQKV